MNTTIDENIVEYRNVDDDEDVISIDTFLENTTLHSQYRPIRVYEWENERNENNRHILVVDAAYAAKIDAEFKKEMRNV